MTISPPAKVKLTPEDLNRILSSGVDSLDIAVDIHWKDESFFEYLDYMQSLTIENEQDQTIQFPESDVYAVLKPYGRKGHKWIIQNNDFDLTIGNWLEPKSRPSVMVSIRSEALWRLGPVECVDILKELLYRAGAESISVKPSRIDLCLDITFPANEWSVELIPLRVTRSRYAAPHFENSTMTGISIGHGIVVARLYDKPLEIAKKSKKFWMYDIWGIDTDIPAELKIIRVEGQFRREAIRQLGIELIDDLFNHIEKLWAYFTQQWLKFETNPGQHHTMRKTLPWWAIVQNGFLGIQDATPLIRCKAINPLKKLLFAQSYGTLTSLMACHHDEQDIPIGSPARLIDLVDQLQASAKENGKSDFELEVDLADKRAKRARANLKMHQAHVERIRLGLPSNIKRFIRYLKQTINK